ncbi:hypothetical protein [Brenneria corticis]|uniref:Uncharacterized protein n=1 Tax=Brenneria corticis TaxID=2173106 RepID=A0A2U1U455_9GAMM|nr:hypothetical protein [Brenneria sp. CFCC 11842]PWC16441.1 hypothetical protein DDT56_10235 [Brenneria sp. CFCC 11842]
MSRRSVLYGAVGCLLLAALVLPDGPFSRESVSDAIFLIGLVLATGCAGVWLLAQPDIRVILRRLRAVLFRRPEKDEPPPRPQSPRWLKEALVLAASLLAASVLLLV